MNACPLPAASAALVDVEALECATPNAAANTIGHAFIRALHVPLEDTRVQEQGLHLHMIQLDSAAWVGYEIQRCGVGADPAQASRSGMYAAIAQIIHATHWQTAELDACRVADYLELPGVDAALGDLVPILAEQPGRRMAIIALQELGGVRTLPVPVVLLHPTFLCDARTGAHAGALHDDFDYHLLRPYGSTHSIAAGPTQEEALLLGMLAAQERMAAGSFAVQGLALRQQRYLSQVDMATLPPQIRSLWELVRQREGHPVHLFDISGRGRIPTYLACVETTAATALRVTAGAGFTCEHAATRALRALLKAHEFTAWSGSRRRDVAEAPDVHRHQGLLGMQEAPQRPFCIQNIQDILGRGGFETVAFGRTVVPVAGSLAGRIQQLHDNFRHGGMTVWVARYPSPQRCGDVACVQVLLTPFDAGFLLLNGVPVSISLASLDAAANDG
ncbi:MAG: YcaO-like family protein [Stenotrophomonas sp.]|nr:YcaO-like family protein [Stenotrophomonas sp.]